MATFVSDILPRVNPTPFSTVGRTGYKPPKDKTFPLGNPNRGLYGFTPKGYAYWFNGDVLANDDRPDVLKNVDNFFESGQDVVGIVTKPIDNTFNAVVDTAKSVPEFLGKLSNPYLWKRIGIGVMGGLFIWWGVLAFLATNKKIQSAITTGAKGALSKTPQGALANLASDAIGS